MRGLEASETEDGVGLPAKTTYSRAVAGKTQAKEGQRMDPDQKRAGQYWERRREIRIRPVNEGNNIEGVRTYLRDHLKIGSASMATLDLERASFERVSFGPKSKIQKEMIVRFPSVEARDLVKA